MELKDVLDDIKQISNYLCQNFELFDNKIESISSPQKQIDESQTVDLKHLYDRVHEVQQKNLNNAYKILQCHSDRLQKKQEEVNKLIKRKETLKIEAKNITEHIQKAKRNYDCYEQKLKGLQNLRDCIKTYKILTGTHFAYKKGSVMGYMKPQNPSNFEVFDLNTSQVNQDDITTKLWSLLEKISKEELINKNENS